MLSPIVFALALTTSAIAGDPVVLSKGGNCCNSSNMGEKAHGLQHSVIDRDIMDLQSEVQSLSLQLKGAATKKEVNQLKSELAGLRKSLQLLRKQNEQQAQEFREEFRSVRLEINKLEGRMDGKISRLEAQVSKLTKRLRQSQDILWLGTAAEINVHGGIRHPDYPEYSFGAYGAGPALAVSYQSCRPEKLSLGSEATVAKVQKGFSTMAGGYVAGDCDKIIQFHAGLAFRYLELGEFDGSGYAYKEMGVAAPLGVDIQVGKDHAVRKNKVRTQFRITGRVIPTWAHTSGPLFQDDTVPTLSFQIGAQARF